MIGFARKKCLKFSKAGMPMQNGPILMVCEKNSIRWFLGINELTHT